MNFHHDLVLRARIEFHGSATPLGNCARVFCAQGSQMPWQLCAVITSNLPTAVMFPFFGAYASGASGGSMTLGSVAAAWNRWNNPGLL